MGSDVRMNDAANEHYSMLFSKVDKIKKPTQFGRALRQLDIDMIVA
ncbi:MAG: hypothetical protein LUP98_06950 [Methylococcaceae bacterium]|nr:hypothetical protein [Methylococcaceae bacterium]